VATWIAVAPSHSTTGSVPDRVQRSAALHETAADELNTQASRLRERGAAAQLRPSTRNPFRFGSSKAARTVAAAPAANMAPKTADAAPVVPAPPNYTLSGVAEQRTPAGPHRTAVISGNGQLYLVTEGEMVGGRYLVVRIDPEAVLLRDATGVELTVVPNR